MRSEPPTKRGVRLIRHVESGVLAVIAVLTIVGVGLEVTDVVVRRDVVLADILLLFLYAEVLAMVAAYMESRRLRAVFPLLIASTALARLIVLQGKDMAPENVLFEAVAILVLAVAITVLRVGDVLRLLKVLARSRRD